MLHYKGGRGPELEQVRRSNLSGNKVLVIDDNVTLLCVIEQILSNAGKQVILASNGTEGLRQFQAHEPDLVILDIMMPVLDGWDVCAQIRQVSHVPIMMVTALGDNKQIVRGLSESGADDYLVKPFSPDILLARTQALLRRAALPPLLSKRAVYEDSHLKIDLDEQRVMVQGQPVKLTTTEYRLLAYMLQNANRVLSFENILKHIWGSEYSNSMDYVHVYISRLRQKLETDPKKPQYFLKQHGIGYRFQKLAGLDR